MPSFHSAGTLPVDHTLVMTLCKASLIGFSAPFRSSAVMPSAQLMKMKLAGNLRDNIVKFAVVPISYSRETSCDLRAVIEKCLFYKIYKNTFHQSDSDFSMFYIIFHVLLMRNE